MVAVVVMLRLCVGQFFCQPRGCLASRPGDCLGTIGLYQRLII